MKNDISVLSLQTPLKEDIIRNLSCGQQINLSGIIYTARDAAHKYLASPNPILPDGLELNGMAIYHCGPVMVYDEASASWKVTAAGPTTSTREEPYMADVIRRYGIRAIIGKGGMGPRTAEACAKFGCAYLSAVGGAAQVLSAAVKEVQAVFFKDEFGSPEAIWKLRIENFPAIVTMDARGKSLHQDILNYSKTILV